MVELGQVPCTVPVPVAVRSVLNPVVAPLQASHAPLLVQAAPTGFVPSQQYGVVPVQSVEPILH